MIGNHDKSIYILIPKADKSANTSAMRRFDQSGQTLNPVIR